MGVTLPNGSQSLKFGGIFPGKSASEGIFIRFQRKQGFVQGGTCSGFNYTGWFKGKKSFIASWSPDQRGNLGMPPTNDILHAML
jgi:hypothetical protein